MLPKRCCTARAEVARPLATGLAMVVPAEPAPSHPIAGTLALIGDRWTLVVVRDLTFGGKRRFKERLASPEGNATNILTERLRRGTLTPDPVRPTRPDRPDPSDPT